jgi:hypothetical protein
MYSRNILDALVVDATDKDISRMVVLINQFSAYRDFADFHKHDPKWWEDLAEKIYSSSPYPNMALAPFTIAASQYLLEPDFSDIDEKVVPLTSKAMAIDEGNEHVQQMARVCMAIKIGKLEPPSMKELRQNVLPSLLKAVKDLDERLTRE